MFGIGFKPNSIYDVVPTLSLVTPNIGSAAGGWTITLTGSGFSNTTNITINSQPCTSLVVVSSNTMTAVAPAYSTTNGNATGQTVTVTNGAGSVSSSGTSTEYFYLPSNTTIQTFHRADVGVTGSGGNLTSWVNQVPGITSTYATASWSSAVGLPSGNFNSTGLPFFSFNGTNQAITSGIGTTIVNGLHFYAMMMQLPSAALLINPNYWHQLHGPSFDNIFYNDGSAHIWSSDAAVAATAVTSSPNSSAHVCGEYPGTGGTAKTFYDGASNTGSVSPAINCNQLTMGGWQTSHFGLVNVLGEILYSAIPSAGDITTIMQILRTTSNTP